MAYEFRVTRRVEFAETDMAGLMHFSNFFRFMEAAEHGFYRAAGFSVVMDRHDPPLGWPRVHAACDYQRPVRFEDLIEVHLLVSDKTAKALSYRFVFRKLNETPPVEVARGELTVVCVARGPDGQLGSVPMPGELAAKIEVAPPDRLVSA